MWVLNTDLVIFKDVWGKENYLSNSIFGFLDGGEASDVKNLNKDVDT